MALDDQLTSTNHLPNRRTFIAAATGLAALLTLGGADFSDVSTAQTNPPASDKSTAPDYSSINEQGVLVKGFDKGNPDKIYLVLELDRQEGNKYQVMEFRNGEAHRLKDEKQQALLDSYGAKLYKLLNSADGSAFYQGRTLTIKDSHDKDLGLKKATPKDIQNYIKRDPKIKDEKHEKVSKNVSINDRGILIKGLDPRSGYRNQLYMIMISGDGKHIEATSVIPTGDFLAEGDEVMRKILNKNATDYISGRTLDYGLKPDRPTNDYLDKYFSPPRIAPGS